MRTLKSFALSKIHSIVGRLCGVDDLSVDVKCVECGRIGSALSGEFHWNIGRDSTSGPFCSKCDRSTK